MPKAAKQKEDPNSPGKPGPKPERTWSSDDDETLLGLRSQGQPWSQIAQLLDIPMTSCRRRYRMLTTKAVIWDDEMDGRLEKAYHRGKEVFWQGLAKELGGGITWRAAENRVWDLGKKKIVKKL